MNPPRARSRLLAPLVVVAAVLGLALLWPALQAPDAAAPAGAAATAGSTPTRDAEQVDPMSGLPWVSLDDLPREASETMDVIAEGAPFPYEQDGSVFRNAEGLLPARPNGYYHEFTVPTPGEGDRGARRIVTGGPDFGAANEEYYWTGDHYESFERIRA